MILSLSKQCRVKAGHVARKAARNVSAAFTVVELIVVIGIFGIIMSVALANQQELNSSLLISNLAYEIGLITRETQAYGIGVRARPGESDPKYFQGAFGMNITMLPNGTADKIVVFKDNDNNGMYTEDADANPGEEETFSVYQFQNQRGNKIVALCSGSYSLPCYRTGTAPSANNLNVIFKRPNPEASFNVIHEGSASLDLGEGGPAIIVVNTAARKNCRAVVIEMTGQIRIESAKGSTQFCLDN